MKTFEFKDANLLGRNVTSLVRAAGEQDLSKFVSRVDDRTAIITIPDKRTKEATRELLNDIIEHCIGSNNLKPCTKL